MSGACFSGRGGWSAHSRHSRHRTHSTCSSTHSSQCRSSMHGRHSAHSTHSRHSTCSTHRGPTFTAQQPHDPQPHCQCAQRIAPRHSPPAENPFPSRQSLKADTPKIKGCLARLKLKGSTTWQVGLFLRFTLLRLRACVGSLALSPLGATTCPPVESDALSQMSV